MSRYKAHRLSLRIAARVAAATLAVVVMLAVLGRGLPLWAAAGAILFLGLCTYVAAFRLLAPRLRLARATLRRIHESDFEDLDAVKENAGSDELEMLMAQVYDTGLGVEKKIRELERLEDYRREFLGNVSHELKTPIFSIRGFAETLLDGALKDKSVRRSFVKKIRRNAERLGNLAEDLGEVARIETGELAMALEPINLLHVTERVIESLEPLAKRKQVGIRHKIPVGLPPVTGDRDRIGQVLSNLVDNAIKYNIAGGQVEIIARLLPTRRVKISVVDDGIGIASEHIYRLTERFFRVDTSRSRSQGGTGLGLAIVKHILGAHGSRLIVESHPNSGSTFGFSLPLATGPASA